MLVIATEEITNQALVSALVASNNQPSAPVNQALVSVFTSCDMQNSDTALVVQPPTPTSAKITGVTVNPPTQANISTIAQAYPITNVKL